MNLRTAFYIVALVMPSAFSQTCPAPTSTVLRMISKAVSARLDLGPDLTIEDQGTLNNSCYRRLLVHSAEPKRIFSLYLSPDQKFVTPEVIDFTIDVAMERARERADVLRLLTANPSPTRGPKAADVTLVEFSDFQCPYCKQFAEYVKTATDSGASLRIMFKHSPLPQHEWARRAAILTACTAAQSNDAFWALHDFIFQNQASLSAGTLENRIKEFLSDRTDVGISLLFECASRNDYDGQLRRDEELAKQFHISETPTVFVNGVRRTGFSSLEDFMAVVKRAHEDAGSKTAEWPNSK